MSTARLAIRGAAFNLLGRICGFGITFVLTPILIHGLGDERYGIWSIVMSLTTYYALADLGLRGATVKYMSQYDGAGDRESVNKVFVTTLGLYCVLALVIASIVGVMAVVVPRTFVTSSIDATTLGWVVLLTGFGVSVVILGQAFDATLAAAKRFDRANTVAIAAQTLQAIMIVIALRLGGALLEMACITLCVTTAARLGIVVFALRSVPYLTVSPRFFEWETARRLFRYGILFVVQGLGVRISRSAGALIVGLILGPLMVTFYVIAESLASKTSALSRSIVSVLMPVASQLEAQGRSGDLIRAYLLTTRTLVAFSVSLAAIFIALGWPLIDFWIGEGYAAVTYPVLFVLSFAVVLQMSSVPSRAILRGTNRVGFLSLIGLVEVTVTIGLGAILTQQFGLIGMAVSVVVAQLVSAATIMPNHACRSLQLSVVQFVVKGILPGMVVCLPGIVLAVVFHFFVPPTNIAHVVIQGACIGLTTCIVLFQVGFERETRAVIVRSFLPKKTEQHKSLN